MTTLEHLYASIKSNPHCSTQNLCQWVRVREPIVEAHLKELEASKKIAFKKRLGWVIV